MNLDNMAQIMASLKAGGVIPGMLSLDGREITTLGYANNEWHLILYSFFSFYKRRLLATPYFYIRLRSHQLD